MAVKLSFDPRRQFIAWIVGGAVVAIIIFSLVAYFQSSKSSPQYHQWDDQDAKHAASQENGAINAPGKARVTILRQQGHPYRENASEYRQRDDGQENPWQLKLSDILIAYFTYCLVIVGWFTVRSGEDSSKRLERPYLWYLPSHCDLSNTITRITYEPEDNRANPYAPIIDWAFFNSGRTVASIDDVRAAFVLAGTLPDEPPFMGTGSINYLDRTVGGNDVSEYQQLTLDKRLSASEVDMLRAGGIFVFLFGAINYSDIFGDEHETMFCLRSERDGELRYWGGKKYNYQT